MVGYQSTIAAKFFFLFEIYPAGTVPVADAEMRRNILRVRMLFIKNIEHLLIVIPIWFYADTYIHTYIYLDLDAYIHTYLVN
jgi:hypothetical protein